MKLKFAQEILFIFLTYLFLAIFAFNFNKIEWQVKILKDYSPLLSVVGVIIIGNYISRVESIITRGYYTAIALSAVIIGGIIYFSLT